MAADTPYVGFEAAETLASHIQKRLLVADTMPASPAEGQVVLYAGATTASFTQGGIYLYGGEAWHLISLSGELVPSVSYYQKGTYTPAGEVQPQEDLAFTVTFATPMPDTDYLVDWWYGAAISGVLQIAIRERTTTGFSGVLRNVGTNSVSAQNCAFNWTAFKLMTDESRALDETAIAQNTSDISDLQDDVESIQAVIPSEASSTNKLAPRGEIYILSNQYSGATYTTVEALLEKVAADMLAKGGYGGAVGCVWTGKSYFSGTYGTNGSTAGNARLHFENAQAGYTECTFNFTSSGLGTVNWFNDVTTSTVTSGSTAPVTSGGVASEIARLQGEVTTVSETVSDASTNAIVARGEIGDITALETTDTQDLVSAINELVHRINAL